MSCSSSSTVQHWFAFHLKQTGCCHSRLLVRTGNRAVGSTMRTCPAAASCTSACAEHGLHCLGYLDGCGHACHESISYVPCRGGCAAAATTVPTVGASGPWHGCYSGPIRSSSSSTVSSSSYSRQHPVFGRTSTDGLSDGIVLQPPGTAVLLLTQLRLCLVDPLARLQRNAAASLQLPLKCCPV